MGLPLEKLPDWPAALNRSEALAYTRVSETQMRAWEDAGAVCFRTRGARGEGIVLRAQLDGALAALFGGANDDSGPRF